MSCDWIRILSRMVPAFLLLGLGGLRAHAQASVATGSIRGRIVDLQTNEPIAKASVSIAGDARSVTTGEDGRFELEYVPAGVVELRISTVGYSFLKRRVEMAAGATLELDVRLGQDVSNNRQEVTVVGRPFEPVVPDAATQYTLDHAELQDLSTVLANDPFRAVANLPGVVADEDYYSDFAVRGAGPAHVGVFLDGVLVDHPAYALEDEGELGSASVVNGDVVGAVALLSGAFPPSYGDRTGAVLDFATRDGSRDGVATRFTADALGAVLTSEGPIGEAKKASWLVSGRQSYLGYLLDRLGLSGGLTLNYNDASGKLSYDLNAHQHFSFFSSFGSVSALRSANYIAGQEASYFTSGAAQHGMGWARWDWMPSSKTLLQTQGFWTHDHQHDTNPYGAVVLDTASDVYGFRQDFTHQAGKWNSLQAGVEVRSPVEQRNSYTQWNYTTDMLWGSLLPFDNYSRLAWQPAAYFEDTAKLPKAGLTLSAGGRLTYFTPSSQAVWLPYASALLKASRKTNVSVAYGKYAQMPSLQELYGAFGNPALRAERATHTEIAFDQFFTDRTRLHLELYNRQEHEDVYSAQTEFRLLANGQVGFPVLGPVLGNNLDGYGRGFEVSLQRRSANRLSGWISYARSYSKDWQPGTGLRFDGDYDQRDTFSGYAAYRISRTIDVSGNSRYGSGIPIPGFFAPSQISAPANPDATVYFQLSQTRNLLRQGDFLRSDVRISKAFVEKRFDLTIHGEIENVTGHVNYSYFDVFYPGNVSLTHLVYVQRESTVPLLPVAGFTLEF